jgi:hypothetical protein
MMRARKTATLVVAMTLVLLGVAEAAQAIRCREWQRMGPDRRSETIDRMIRNAVEGSSGRQYQFDRGAIARCMRARVQTIEWDFDGACADSRSAGMQALNNIFKNHIWDCSQ